MDIILHEIEKRNLWKQAMLRFIPGSIPFIVRQSLTGQARLDFRSQSFKRFRLKLKKPKLGEALVLGFWLVWFFLWLCNLKFRISYLNNNFSLGSPWQKLNFLIKFLENFFYKIYIIEFWRLLKFYIL